MVAYLRRYISGDGRLLFEELLPLNQRFKPGSYGRLGNLVNSPLHTGLLLQLRNPIALGNYSRYIDVRRQLCIVSLYSVKAEILDHQHGR